MTYQPHDLATEFPDDLGLLQHLKATKGYFAVLADRYQEVDRAIMRIEADLDTVSGARLDDLKKERLHLLNRIGGQIRDALRSPA